MNFENIESAICAHFDITPEQVRAKNRKKVIAKARHYIYYFSAAWCPLSYAKIADNYQQNHTAVTHAVKKIDGAVQMEAKYAMTPKITKEVAEIGAKIKAQ